MPTSVDERVVSMKFDNKSFEQNAEVSLKTLDTLKQKLDFSGIKQSLGQIDTSSLKKAFENIGNIDTSKLNSALDTIQYRMSTLGTFMGQIVSNIADDLYGIVKNAMAQIDKVINFAEEGIVTGGYNRAFNIQTAKFQLEGLGIAWEEIADDINFAVKDTAYSLDQAAIVASRLSTSGIRPGETWTDYSGQIRDEDTMAMILRSISGTASATGGRADYAQIGNILTKMISYGKVNLQQLNELGTFGIGAKGIIAEYMNKIGYQGSTSWEESDISDITASRTSDLDPMLVIEALYDKFGEHAVKANETLTGVIANTKSALARIGANFWEPLLENSGPLVGIMEVVRQSLNDLNGAIGPVVNAFAVDLAGVLDRIKGLFMTKEYIYDEDGNLVYDEMGNPMSKWSLRKKGGIFSSFFEPWTTEKTWVDDSDHVPTNLPGDAMVGHWEEAESRAVRIANNIRETLNNLIDVGQTVFKTIGAAIKEVFPNAEGLAGLLVRITEWLKNVTESWKNSSLFDSEHGWEKSNFYRIVRGLAAAVDIVIHFGKSFKEHIIDPIFNNSSVSTSGIGDAIAGVMDAIWEFDERLKNGEDVFGPFLEGIKDGLIQLKEWITTFIDWVSPYLKDFFGSIINWWKPVKDILFDTDISWSDKWGAIKDYFAENFELPGWSKVKTIFEGIGSAISFVVDKIRDFFGWNEKSDTLSTDPAASPLKHGGMASLGMVGGNGQLDMVRTIQAIDVNSEKLPTIGERLKSFGESLASIFGNFNPGQFKTAAYAVLGALGILVLGVIYLMYKGYNALKSVGTKFPVLFGGVIQELQKTVGALGKMFKAQAFEAYAAGFKNLAAAVALLTITIVAVGAMIAVIETVGGEEKIQSAMRQAFVMVTSITALFGVIALGFVKLSQNAATMGLSISKAGVALQLPSDSIGSLNKVLATFVVAVVSFTALIMVLGLAMTTDKGKEVMEAGFDELLNILILLGISIGAILAVTRLFSFGEVSGANFAKALAGVGATIAAVGTSLMFIVGAIAILGLLKKSETYDRGIEALEEIGKDLVVFLGAVMFISGLSSAISGGTLKGSTIASTLVGLSLLVFTVVGGITSLVASIVILDKLGIEPDLLSEYVKQLFDIGLIIAGIPVALLAVVTACDAFTKTGKINFRTLASIAAMIASVGLTFFAMAVSLKILDTVDTRNTIIPLVGFIAIFAVFGAIVAQLNQMTVEEMKKATSILGAIGMVILAVSASVLIMARYMSWNIIGSFAIIAGTLLGFQGFLYLLGEIVSGYGEKIDENDLKTFDRIIAAVRPVLLTIMLTLGAIIASIAIFDANPASLGVGAAAIMLTLFEFVSLLSGIYSLVEYTNKQGIKKNNFDRIAELMTAAATSMGIMAITMAAVFSVIGATQMGAGTTLVAGASFIGMMYMFTKIIDELAFASKEFTTAKQVERLQGVMYAAAATIVVIGGVMSIMFAAIGASGLGGAGALAASIGFSIAVLAIGFIISYIVNQLQKVTVDMKMVGAIALALAAVVLPIIIIAFAVGKLVNSIQKSGISTGKLAATIGLLLAMVAVPAALIILGGAFKGLDDDQLKNIAYFSGVLVGVALALAMVANALTKLAKQDSGQISRAALVLSLMAGVMSIVVVVLAKVNAFGNIGQAITNLVSFAGVCATLYIIAGALKKVAAIEFKNMKESLIAMGVVVGLAVAIAAILGAFHTVGAGALKAGALLLGMGVMLAGLGVFMVLFAEGMNTFMDMILELNGKSDQISGGTSSFLIGFAEGLLESFKKFNEMLPEMLEELRKFIDGLFNWVNTNLAAWFVKIKETIKISLKGIADIVNDKEIQDSAVGIVTGILDFLIKGADTWVPKILELAGIIARELWKGIFGTPLPKDWVDITGWLVSLGEQIDNFFGGAPSHVIEIGLEPVLGGPMQDAVAKVVPTIIEHYQEELKAVWLQLGYTTEQWERLKREMPEFYESMYSIFVNADLGDEELQKWIENQGGVGEAMYNAVKTGAKKLGALPNVSLTDIFDNSDPMAQDTWATWTMSSLNRLTSFIGSEWQPEMQEVMQKVGASLSGAFSEGDSGRLYEEAKQTLWSIYEGTDDPAAKERIYAMYRALCTKSIVEFGIAGGGNGRGSRMLKWYMLGVSSILDYCSGLIDTTKNRQDLFATLRINTKNGVHNALGFAVEEAGLQGRRTGFAFEQNASKPVNVTTDATVDYDVVAEYRPSASIGPKGSFPATFISPAEFLEYAVAQPFSTPLSVNSEIEIAFDVITTTNFTGGVSEGILAGASAGLRDKMFDSVLNGFDYGSGKAYYFVPIGQYVTAGITAGMTNGTSKSYISNASISLKNLFVDGIRSSKAFDIRSPAHDEEIRYAGSMITAGLATGAEEGGQPYINDAATGIANGFGSSLTNAMGSVDLTSIGTTLKNNITAKIPSWDSMKSNFGWEKGLSGNLQGVKNVWNQLKSSFMGEDGGFDINSLFGGLSDKLKGGLSGLFSGFDMNSMGMDFDMSSMLSFGADSITDGIDFSNWQDEFSTFDASNLDNTVELNIEVNDMKWNQWKDDNTGIMVDAIPTMGGFQRSTVGSTYVNNYNYNQTNNSPTALNTREINRQTELLINRNRSRWAK